MTFRVGMKVVCVDPVGSNPALEKGRIYTVDCVYGEGISVIEIPAPSNAGYFFWRFRPIVERKTDIAIFTKMLKPQEVDA